MLIGKASLSLKNTQTEIHSLIFQITESFASFISQIHELLSFELKRNLRMYRVCILYHARKLFQSIKSAENQRIYKFLSGYYVNLFIPRIKAVPVNERTDNTYHTKMA